MKDARVYGINRKIVSREYSSYDRGMISGQAVELTLECGHKVWRAASSAPKFWVKCKRCGDEARKQGCR